ncbi:MAG: hypothetical protein ABIG85_02910 [Chloroflexota bacterium]
MDAPRLVRAVTAYTARTLPDLLRLGPATTALAPWMLTALVAPAASGEDREAIEDALGLEADEASQEVGRLLSGGPAALRAAVATWRSNLLATDGDLGRWEASIPEGAARGPIPSQADADEWTRLQTLGLIDRFPLQLDADTLCVLAAAIATRVTWTWPLDVIAAPTNAWGVGRMLAADVRGVVDTPVGLVGVAEADSSDRLTVYSFIADRGVELDEIATTALRLLSDWYLERREPEWIPADKLGAEGHAWTVSIGHGGGDALVPAFEERSNGADISGLAGIRDAAAILGRLALEAAPAQARRVAVDAAMSAMARYDRRGFEAAAVATMLAPASISMARPVLTLHFDRPHLVVAVSTDEAYAGLPLFEAWVGAGVREPEGE